MTTVLGESFAVETTHLDNIEMFLARCGWPPSPPNSIDLNLLKEVCAPIGLTELRYLDLD